MNARLKSMEVKIFKGRCLECRDWPDLVMIIETWGAPMPYPDKCPRCGRINTAKLVERRIWEAI